MPRKTIVATIEAVYDSEGVVFWCEGEPLEDMEFSWEDLADPELCAEAAEELAEYVDAGDLEDVDHPVETISRALDRLCRTAAARQALDGYEMEDDDTDGDEEDEEG